MCSISINEPRWRSAFDKRSSETNSECDSSARSRLGWTLDRLCRTTSTIGNCRNNLFPWNSSDKRFLVGRKEKRPSSAAKQRSGSSFVFVGFRLFHWMKADRHDRTFKSEKIRSKTKSGRLVVLPQFSCHSLGSPSVSTVDNQKWRLALCRRTSSDEIEFHQISIRFHEICLIEANRSVDHSIGRFSRPMANELPINEPVWVSCFTRAETLTPISIENNKQRTLLSTTWPILSCRIVFNCSARTNSNRNRNKKSRACVRLSHRRLLKTRFTGMSVKSEKRKRKASSRNRQDCRRAKRKERHWAKRRSSKKNELLFQSSLLLVE